MCGCAEAAGVDALADDVGDVGADGLGHRDDLGGADAARHLDSLLYGDGMRAQVEGHRNRRHSVAEQFDQPPDEPGQVAPVRNAVVADGIGSLDGDAGAVRQHAVEWFQRQACRLQCIQRPGHDPYVVEAAGERHLREAPCLTGVPADDRVCADDNDQTAVGCGRDVHASPPVAGSGSDVDGGLTRVPQPDG